MSSWSFCYDHDAYEPSITVPTSFLILFLISSSHFSTVWLHMVHRFPQSQRAVFTTHSYSMLTMAQPGTPLRTGQGELGLRTLSVFADEVNSAVLSAPFVCIPIGITGLTSEMKTADWTGFLKGSSCRNLKPFPSSRLVTTCQENFHRNPVNFCSFKSHLKRADRQILLWPSSFFWMGQIFFFFFPSVKPSMSAARVNLSTNHTYPPSLPKEEPPGNPGLGDSLNHHVYQSVGQRIRLEESNLFSFYYYY